MKTKILQQVEALRAYAEAGLLRGEAAANLGISLWHAGYLARKAGIKFKHGNRKATPNARAVSMHKAYLAGRSLESIGNEHGVTRERVRQIITKFYGRIAKEAGPALLAQKAREKRLAALDAQALAKWGCTRKQLAILRRMGRRLMEAGASRERTPIGAYVGQRRNANTRGIGWEINLWDWWTVWQKSGKWSRRGRQRGQFVMCRKGDTGPYSKDNVFIDLACRNTSAATRANDLPMGVYKKAQGYEAFTVRNKQPVVLGCFDTPQEAHIAYLRALHREAA